MGNRTGKEKNPEMIIEHSQRLSQSKLWELQTAAYCQFGPRAWAEGGVPFYITSNPFIARQYVLLALGYLRDCLSPNAKTPINVDEPIYFIDLGAGTGRFGFLFLRYFFEMMSTLRRWNLKIRYVMTDIAISNINFWRTHPHLQRLIQDGILDFAYYHHAEETKPLQLMISGQELSADVLKNPLILIGNYFFDTIPQDLFMVKDGKVLEGRITLSVIQDEKTQGITATDPRVINHLQDKYDYVNIEDIDNYYPDFPELIPLLTSYVESLENFPFLFPTGAFKAIRYFSKLSNNRLLLMAGDQGTSTEQMLKHKKYPYIARHGTFSIPINYHAISRYFRMCGGMSLLTTYAEPVLVVTGSVLGGSLEEYPETHLAFKQNMDYFDSNDYFFLLDYTEKEWMTPTVDFLILLIKLGNWDPTNCYLFFERIRDELPHTTDQTKSKLADAIHRSWDNFYPVGPDEAIFAMNLGVLFFDMKLFRDAALFFERAIAIKDDIPLVYRNLALTYKELGEQEKALQCEQKEAAIMKVQGLLSFLEKLQ